MLALTKSIAVYSVKGTTSTCYIETSAHGIYDVFCCEMRNGHGKKFKCFLKYLDDVSFHVRWEMLSNEHHQKQLVI